MLKLRLSMPPTIWWAAMRYPFGRRSGLLYFDFSHQTATIEDQATMSGASNGNLKNYIRDIPDFPKPGILFRDITPLLASPDAFQDAIDRLSAPFRDSRVTRIVAAEARGFVFAAPMALELKVGFVPIRKPGKLPYQRHSFEYELEYGSDKLEMHVDGVDAGDRVLVVDDLLATGGTVDACCQLLEKCGAEIVACAFLIELDGLGGRQKIGNREIISLIRY